MTSAARSHPILSAIEELLAGFGRATGKFMVAAVDHGPEVLAALAQIQVEGEYVRLLQAEWANHPLLDFIEWQDMSAAQILALTMPQEAVLGHAELADLLRPVCTAPATLDALERVVRAPELASFAADEFLDGLATVRTRRLDRAVTRLTVGLEGLLRITAVTLGGLTDVEARKLDSGYELVKRLWSDRSHYKAYMKAWVFGMSNTYRHGDDGGAAEQQALHALCGAAIWSQHLMATAPRCSASALASTKKSRADSALAPSPSSPPPRSAYGAPQRRSTRAARSTPCWSCVASCSRCACAVARPAPTQPNDGHNNERVVI